MRKPTYGEWFMKISAAIVEKNLIKMAHDSDKLSDLYCVISAILNPALETPTDHYNDFNKVVESCIETIMYLSPERKIAAIAYLEIMVDFDDKIANTIARRILEKLQ